MNGMASIRLAELAVALLNGTEVGAVVAHPVVQGVEPPKVEVTDGEGGLKVRAVAAVCRDRGCRDDWLAPR